MERRTVMKLGLGALGTMIGGKVLAGPDRCGLTPAQTKGPFYPVRDQSDKDSDLLWVEGHQQSARGEVVILRGVVSDQICRPVHGALVEIWQACVSGKYDHPSDPNPAPADPHFQYWGKAITDEEGRYQFRTIIPGSYPADTGWIRPPHIHFKVTKKAYFELVTQMYFAGQTLNEKDLILKSLSPAEQEKVIVEFLPAQGELAPVGKFDLTIRKVIV